MAGLLVTTPHCSLSRIGWLKESSYVKRSKQCHIFPLAQVRLFTSRQEKCIVRASSSEDEGGKQDEQGEEVLDGDKLTQVILWRTAAAYVLWLFVLPFAPGDPAWNINPETVTMLADLSLNFFYVLPLANIAGIHVLEAPVVHPTVEALFNFVIGWTIMFGPLIFSDERRNRFKWSLEALWLCQLFLTNTFLIPYMAIRLNVEPVSRSEYFYFDLDNLGRSMLSNARIVAVVGGLVGIISLLWVPYGRLESDFGDLSERWSYFLHYIFTDRVGYAFVWDIGLYSIFQTWLIRENLSNVSEEQKRLVQVCGVFPYFGLVVYLWCLKNEENVERC